MFYTPNPPPKRKCIKSGVVALLTSSGTGTCRVLLHMTRQSRSGCTPFGGYNTCDPSGSLPQVVCLQQASVNPTVQLSDWPHRSLAPSNTVARARKQKPTGKSKLCFKSLQGPSPTSLLRVNMRGDGLYCSTQATQWVLVSDCVDQTLPSRINKSYYKISH